MECQGSEKDIKREEPAEVDRKRKEPAEKDIDR
jgi:hypothetical protein